jgi:hypothetical protein
MKSKPSSSTLPCRRRSAASKISTPQMLT